MLNSLEKTYPPVLYVCPQCLLAQTAQYRMGMKFLVMIMFTILLKGLLSTKECIKRRLSFEKLRYEISNVWALSRQ